MDDDAVLRLPDFDDEPLPSAQRSIDEVDRWIEQDAALFFDREVYERRKRLLSVDVPFVL